MIEFNISESKWIDLKEEKPDFTKPIWIKYVNGNINLMTHLQCEGFSGLVPVVNKEGKFYPKGMEMILTTATHWQPLNVA